MCKMVPLTISLHAEVNLKWICSYDMGIESVQNIWFIHEVVITVHVIGEFALVDILLDDGCLRLKDHTQRSFKVILNVDLLSI